MGRDDRRLIYRGRKIDLALQSVTLADGTTAERELILHRGAVALLPMLDADHVVLIRNWRYSVGRELLEIPAGTLDPGESPDLAAPRELREETGYDAGRVEKVAEWLVSPGFLDERMSLYLCTDLRPGAARPEPDERIEPVVVPWADALAMVRDGRIEDAKTMLALLYCDPLRNRSRAGG